MSRQSFTFGYWSSSTRRFIAHAGRLLACGLLTVSLAPASAKAETVALGSFAHIDFERNDPDTTAAFATTIQAGLDKNPRWNFVEREALDRVFDEHGLGKGGFASADTAARVGRLLKADLLLSGTVFTPKNAKAYIILECDELARAESLGQTKVELDTMLQSGRLAMPTAEDQQRIVTAAAVLLEHSADRLTAYRNRTILKLLFLGNQSSNPALNGLENLLTASLERTAASTGTHRVLRLERPEIATKEGELALLGLVEADAAAWAQVADYYFWGSCQFVGGTVTVMITQWNGREEPREFSESAPLAELPALADRLARAVIAAAPPLGKEAGLDAGADQRVKVSSLLTRQAIELRSRDYVAEPNRTGRQPSHLEQRRLLAAAVFFAPGEKEPWLQLLLTRLLDRGEVGTMSDLLRRIGDLEYGLEVAERFLAQPGGGLNLAALDGVTAGFDDHSGDRMDMLLSALEYFHEDLRDVYAGRNLLSLRDRVTTAYRERILRLGRLVATASASQDEYRLAAEFILKTALNHPFSDQERATLIQLLWPNLKPAIAAYRAWKPSADRRQRMDGLLRTFFLDHKGPAAADALAVLSPDELAVALKLPAPGGSPARDKLMSMELAEQQVTRISRYPNAQSNAGLQKNIEQIRARIAADQAAYHALELRARSYLSSHSETTDSAVDQATLLQGPIDPEIAVHYPLLESYPPVARTAHAKWLRDRASEVASDGFPDSLVNRMHAAANSLEREAVTAPGANASPVGPEWLDKPPGLFDPRIASQLLRQAAGRGDLPSLQALLARGAAIEAAGAALAAAIHTGQWPAARYLLDRGYDPSAPWPAMYPARTALDQSDHPARVALAEAAVQGKTEFVDLLLRKGTRFDRRSPAGMYAVLQLVRGRRPELLRTLLAAGGNPNGWLQEQQSPLYHAIRQRDLTALKILLDAGANPTEGVGATITLRSGLEASRQWEKYDRALLAEHAVDYCARVNWLEGARLLLASNHPDLPQELTANFPHFKATQPAVRAAFVRAELNAMAPSSDAARAGIDLFTAIAAADQEGFAAALKRPGAMDFRGVWGESPLMFACEEKAWDMARSLIDSGAKLNDFSRVGSTPLGFAARNGGIKIVELLVEKGADINLAGGRANRPLDQAIAEGRNAAMALKLLSLGASYGPHPTKPTVIPLFQATVFNLPEVVHELIRRGDNPHQTADGFSIFFPAARSNNPDLIQYFFDLKCDLGRRTDDGWTPLMSAVRWGAPESVRKLLELGLRDPNAANLSVRLIKELQPKDRPEARELRGLHYHPDYRQCLEIMEEFGQIADSRIAKESIFWSTPHTIPEIETHLKAGGNINHLAGTTPLQNAVNRSAWDIAEYLLSQGANPNLVGDTSAFLPPLQAALSHPRTLELLLMHGANPNERNSRNENQVTLLAYACLNTWVPIESVRLLVRYGADPNVDARTTLERYASRDDPRGTENILRALEGK